MSNKHGLMTMLLQSASGTFDSEAGLCILDNSADHYLVIHPDTLVSGTTVSMATKCLRQSVLNERFRTDDQSEVMLIGTLLHDLFDLAMEFHGESIIYLILPWLSSIIRIDTVCIYRSKL